MNSFRLPLAIMDG